MSRPKGPAFKKMLEDNIRAILNDATAESAVKIQAINAGVKLELMKYKIDGDSEDGAFFGKQRRSRS